MSKQLARNLLRAIVRLQLRLARLSQRGNADAAMLFQSAWSALHKRKLVAWCVSRSRQRFQPDVAEGLLLQLLDALRKQGLPFQPSTHLQATDDIRNLLTSGAPLIVVTSHTGFAATTLTLLHMGVPLSWVTDALPAAELARRYRRILETYPGLQLVPKDRYSLARLHEALRNGRTISCATDYQDEVTKTYSLVSPAIFEFARRIDATLLMSKTVVNDDGSITTILDGPHHIADAEASALAFIDFLNAGRHTPKCLQLKYPPAP